MPIDKSGILKELEALKIVNSIGFPKLKNLLKVDFKNYKTNPLEFLLGILKILLGWEQLKNGIVNFLILTLPKVESSVKILLKNLYKQTFNCSTDSIIPPHFINTGFLIEIKDIDFFGLLRTNPNTLSGEFFYGGDQLDLNKVLYNAINSGNATWGNLLIFEYIENGIIDGEIKTDILRVKLNSIWLNKRVNDFLDKFIDSIVLFSVSFIINNTLNNLFGNFYVNLKIKLADIKRREQLFTLIDKIISLEEEIIDDSYFDFSKNEINVINAKVNNLSKGIKILKDCDNYESQIQDTTINAFNNELEITSTVEEVKYVVENSFSILEKDVTEGLSNNNKRFGLFEFYLSFFKNILYSFVLILFSPKMLLLFKIYGKITNNSIGYTDFKDFLLKHKDYVIQLIRNILLPIIIDFLLEIIIKEIRKLLINDKINALKEKNKLYQYHIFSLLGIPDRVTNILNVI